MAGIMFPQRFNGLQPGGWLFYLKDQFDGLNFNKIIGVRFSQAHQNFTEKQALTIDLISDKEEVLYKHFDVIKKKNMYGKQVIIERSLPLFSQ